MSVRRIGSGQMIRTGIRRLDEEALAGDSHERLGGREVSTRSVRDVAGGRLPSRTARAAGTEFR